MRFVSLEVSGMKKSALIFAVLVSLTLAIFAAPSRRFPQINDWNSLVIVLERGGCFGSCPSYRVEVHGDGTVIYDGGGFVAVTGKHRGAIPKSSVTSLVDAFRTASYFSLRDSYRAGVTDSATYQTSISFDHSSKRVTDYVGQMVGMPERVTQLEDTIDKLSDSARWTKGDANTFHSLTEENFDFHSTEAAGALARIAEYGDVTAVRDFVNAGTGVETKEGFWTKNSALDWAARRGDVEMLQALLLAHPSKSVLTGALSFAADAGNLTAVRLLIVKGADPLRNPDWPPIVAAAHSGVPSVVKEILQYHPDLSAHSKEGNPALIVAVDRRYGSEPQGVDRPAVVRMLLEAGADVDQRGVEGDTALIANAWDPKIAVTLLQHGADVNAQRNDGWTALFSASSPELAKFLLDHGVSIGIRDKKGETALDASRQYSSREKIALLEQAQNAKK